MKKNLRLLCLGLATAIFTSGFAQVNKTDLLQNADMEQGRKGWAFEGGNIMGKNTKNLSTQTGFYGMGQGVLESWKSNGEGLADSYIMQRVGGGELPNGTYVFGAYIGASKQYHRKQVKVMVDGKETTKYKYWSNRDSVAGVEIFANEATQRVATNNPDYNSMIDAEGKLYNDGHATKFNVAVKLTEDYSRPGYLTVGLRYKETNANYVVWDNATLYYFGDMSEAEALDAMARIDMDAAIAIADTLKNVYMNVDTLTALTQVLKDCADAEVTAANFEEISNELFWTARQARLSATDYSNLKKNIESAEKLLEMEWSEYGYYTEDVLPLLEEILGEAQDAYDAAEMDRAELNVLRKRLNWTAGDLKLDSLYYAQSYLEEYSIEAGDRLNEAGGFSQAQIDELNALLGEVADTLAVYEEEMDAALDFEDRKVNPNNLVPYIARVFNTIEKVESNPLSKEVTRMPLTIPAAADGWLEGTETVDGLKVYKSPVYRFAENVTEVTFTVKKNQGGSKFFSLSELSLYDVNNKLIELEEENLSSDYDHNALNETPDGGGLGALVDGVANTYFHSAWGNIPAGDHSIKVTLPDGGYDAFSFKIVSRASNQNHQFPAEMVVSVPMPERDALQAKLNEANAYEAYSNSEVGFYEADYSFLTGLIAEIEVALDNYPTETECAEMREELEAQMEIYNNAFDPTINLPVEGKKYRLISGFPNFYNKQFVEKAITAHVDTTSYTLWWGNVAAADKNQEFVFEPILDEEGENYIEVSEGTNADGTTWSKTIYCYKLKNVGAELYVDTTANNQVQLAAFTNDTVRFEWLGRGQWNIHVKGATLHCGDHNGGNVGGDNGAYGGTWGVGSGIVNWGSGIDDASAWFIREYPELPLSVLVSGSKFKSECIHFEAANTVTLTANKACAFKDLTFYDLYGKVIAAESVEVVGNKATAMFANDIVACAFAFTNTNSEGDFTVVFNATEYTPSIDLLQAAYDAAVAVAPVEGTDVMQYADLSAYNTALEEAEAMLLAGAGEAEINAMVKKLEDVVAALKPNMPVAGKYYFIYSAYERFEKDYGYRMTLCSKSSEVSWMSENYLEWNRYWQFEPATEEELNKLLLKKDGDKDVVDTEKVAASLGKSFYIKNVATNQYVGYIAKKDFKTDATIPMTSSKTAAIPYKITSLESGTIIALDEVVTGQRLHGKGHGGTSGQATYWGSGLGSSSAWTISETQYDVTDIDFAEVETEKAVVKGIFDLFGRRIDTPTASGIYIIDGKKKYIKK